MLKYGGKENLSLRSFPELGEKKDEVERKKRKNSNSNIYFKLTLKYFFIKKRQVSS